MRVCFCGYRDVKDEFRLSYKKFTDNIEEIKDFILKTVATGGDDPPEDVQGGMKVMALMEWSTEASK